MLYFRAPAIHGAFAKRRFKDVCRMLNDRRPIHVVLGLLRGPRREVQLAIAHRIPRIADSPVPLLMTWFISQTVEPQIGAQSGPPDSVLLRSAIRDD